MSVSRTLATTVSEMAFRKYYYLSGLIQYKIIVKIKIKRLFKLQTLPTQFKLQSRQIPLPRQKIRSPLFKYFVLNSFLYNLMCAKKNKKDFTYSFFSRVTWVVISFRIIILLRWDFF